MPRHVTAKGGARQTVLAVSESDASRICAGLGQKERKAPLDLEARELIRLQGRTIARLRAENAQLLDEADRRASAPNVRALPRPLKSIN